VSRLPPSPSSDPQAAAKAQPWVQVPAVASFLCSFLSLLLSGLILVGPFPSEWSFGPGLACSAMGAVLGHLARRAMCRSSDTVLATAGLLLSYGTALLSIALFVALFWALAAGGPFPPGN